MARYGIYAGWEHAYDVYLESDQGEKIAWLSGHKTSNEARAARKRYEEADKRRSDENVGARVHHVNQE
jgi:hypothetical protein